MSLKQESYKSGFIYSFVINILSKISFFGLSLFITYFFGANKNTDLYFFIASNTVLLGGFVTNIDNLVILPESIRLRRIEGSRSSWNFINSYFLFFCALAILLSLLTLIMPAGVLQLVTHFKLSDYPEAVWMVRLLGPNLLLAVLILYLSDILVSHKFFTFPLYLNLLNNVLCVSLYLIVFRKLSVVGFFYANFSSNFMQLVILIGFCYRKLNWQIILYKVNVDKLRPNLLFFSIFGYVFTFAIGFYPYYILSSFAHGMVTAFNIGKSLSEVPTNFISQQFGTVAGIKMNELAANKEYNKIDVFFTDSIEFILFILFPLGVLMYHYGLEIITILYKRGSFSVASCKETAFFFSTLVALIPCMLINAIVARVLSAYQKVKEGFYYQVAFSLLLLICISVCTHFWGIYGYIYSLFILYIANVFFIQIVFNLCSIKIKYQRTICNFIRNVLLNIVPLFCLLMLERMISFNMYLKIILGSFVYLLLLLLIANMTRFGRKQLGSLVLELKTIYTQYGRST